MSPRSRNGGSTFFSTKKTAAGSPSFQRRPFSYARQYR
ncbi:hypothetical protein MPS_0910 [Mycobacterium pseudoshottsii JCM 15466]|nr:hypothetical protein MPS_0910 [Mycobacterium pseudoshottsii JCM 15466]